MKKLFLTAVILITGANAFAFYDFCQSPQDYNTFPAQYDFRTEYWRDIPTYNTDKIQYKYEQKSNPSDRTLIKQSPEFKKNYEPQK